MNTIGFSVYYDKVRRGYFVRVLPYKTDVFCQREDLQKTLLSLLNTWVVEVLDR